MANSLKTNVIPIMKTQFDYQKNYPNVQCQKCYTLATKTYTVCKIENQNLRSLKPRLLHRIIHVHIEKWNVFQLLSFVDLELNENKFMEDKN